MSSTLALSPQVFSILSALIEERRLWCNLLSSMTLTCQAASGFTTFGTLTGSALIPLDPASRTVTSLGVRILKIL